MEKTESCFLWKAHTNRYGYGQISIGRKNVLAHRLSWELHNGPIPDGLHVCHKCDVRNCVNPNHLFLGTTQDNTADKMKKGRHVSGIGRGEGHLFAKLSEDNVRDIRRLLSNGIEGVAIAREYNITKSLVSQIKLKKIWNHVL